MRSQLIISAAVLLLAAPAFADTTLVDENFDSYATQGAFEAVWTPDAGDGVSPTGTTGILLPTTDPNFITPNDSPPGLVGGGVGNFGGINEFSGALSATPSETESVFLSGDIFVDGVTATWRQTIGLRNDTIDREPGVFGPQLGSNLIEMGFYNASTCDPTAAGCDTSSSVIQDPADPNFIGSTQFAYRLVIFQFGSLGKLFHNGEEVGDLLAVPNWQYFPLDPALDLVENGGNGDEVVNIADIGEGFHTFSATVTPTDITLELDLLRNGVNEITGLAEPDSTVKVEIGLFEDPANPGEVAEFTSLRIGGPSGITSLTGEGGDANPGSFDNIFLGLVDVIDSLAGDYNGDGVVDGIDYALWRETLGDSVAEGTGADGNSNSVIDSGDFSIWQANFGAAAAGVVVIPEPTALLLAMLSATGLLGMRRK